MIWLAESVNALGASSNLNILWTCCDLLLIDRLVSGSSWHQKLMEWTTWDQHLCFMFSVISDLVYVLMQQTHWYPLVILFQTPTLCSAYFWLLLLFYMIGFSNLTHKYLCLWVSVMCICLQPRITTKPSILQRFWSIWFGACKSAPQQLLHLLSHTEGLSMLLISHPYFSNSSLKMQKLIIGKSYALTLTRVRRGWKNFLQVIDYSHPV